MERFQKMCSFDQTQKPRSWKITAKGNPALAPLRNFGSHYDTDCAISSGCHAKVAHTCHAGRQRMFGYARQTGSFLLPRGHLQYRWNSAFWTRMPGRTFSHKVSWLMPRFKAMTTTLLGTKYDAEPDRENPATPSWLTTICDEIWFRLLVCLRTGRSYV